MTPMSYLLILTLGYLPIGFILYRGNPKHGIFYAVITPLILNITEFIIFFYIFSNAYESLIIIPPACLLGFIGGWLGKLSLKSRLSA